MDLLKFAENLRERRHIMGLTQAEMASRLNLMPQTVSKWERGLSAPDIDNLIELATLLNVTVDELIRPDSYLGRTFIAIDGGGTKTEFIAFTEDGHIIRHLLRGSTNPNVVGAETAKINLTGGLDELLIGIRPCGVFAGVAGSMTHGNNELLTDAITSRVGDIPVYVNSDILNVIHSVPDIGRCIAVICGTGSSAFAWNGEELTRYGGWGYLFDGAGSGYDIGCDILRECFALDDGFGEQSLVTRLAEEKLGGRAIDRLNEFYSGQRDFIASFAPYAFKAYRQGDKVAKKIIKRNMGHLAFLIESANGCSFNNENCDVIISGGLTKDSDIITECLRDILDDKYNFIFPDLPQIYGAVVATLKFCHEDSAVIDMDEFHKAFADDYNKIRKEHKQI